MVINYKLVYMKISTAQQQQSCYASNFAVQYPACCKIDFKEFQFWSNFNDFLHKNKGNNIPTSPPTQCPFAFVCIKITLTEITNRFKSKINKFFLYVVSKRKMSIN